MKTKASILGIVKVFFLLLFSCYLFSCNRKWSEEEYKIREIDGCEYIESRNAYGDVLSHKGNCKNPIHYKLSN